VLKPGGRLILVDLLQTGDEPDYDAMLDGSAGAFLTLLRQLLAEDLARPGRPGFPKT
jgi:hypothetical protein